MATQSTSPTHHGDYTKRERILNALAVYPNRYVLSNQAIAELTGASTSWVYQVRAEVAEGELTENAVHAALNETLQAEYSERLEEVLEEFDVPRTFDTEDREQRPTGTLTNDIESTVSREAEGLERDVVTIEVVERVRDVMDQYRADADFERDHFNGVEKNVAEEKYLIAKRAVELLDLLVNAADRPDDQSLTSI